MRNPSTLLSHIEINVSEYVKSIRFYDQILLALGWKRIFCSTDYTAYCDGHLKVILSPTHEAHVPAGFHRKRIGLNHLAFYAPSREEVDKFYRDVLGRVLNCS